MSTYHYFTLWQAAFRAYRRAGGRLAGVAAAEALIHARGIRPAATWEEAGRLAAELEAAEARAAESDHGHPGKWGGRL